MQRDFTLKLITLVKSYPCLYDHTLPDYSKKRVTDEIWNEIARKLRLPVAECINKWRTIRGSYLRSMKYAADETKTTKPYHLHEHLQFIVPFLKPKSISILESLEENSQVDLSPQPDVKPELSVSSIEDSDDEASQKVTEISVDNIVTAGRKRNATSNYTDYFEDETNVTREETAMRYFVLSLLPELNAMNDTQRWKFKVKVVLLIDEILSSNTTTND